MRQHTKTHKTDNFQRIPQLHKNTQFPTKTNKLTQKHTIFHKNKQQNQTKSNKDTQQNQTKSNKNTQKNTITAIIFVQLTNNSSPGKLSE